MANYNYEWNGLSIVIDIKSYGSTTVYINESVDDCVTKHLSDKEKVQLTKFILIKWNNEVLPNYNTGFIFECSAYNTDGKGTKRASLYKRLGFKQGGNCYYLTKA